MSNKHISHYKILNKIGSGGMSEVYQAIDLETKQHVALKVLLPHLASDNVIRKRFFREARVGMDFQHPGVVKVYEVNEENNLPFIVMELLEGDTLDNVIKTRKPDLNNCIDIALQIADVLAAAHKKNIIHRDIKPSNIMLTDDTIKVMDFGLARVLDTSSLTKRYEILGTMSYMSPEQTIGAHIDARCDIYAFGVVLYQMFTGVLPFQAQEPGALIHAILYSDPLRISELGIDIPPELEQVVFKALNKKPQLRYQSADELMNDLQRVKDVIKGKTVKLIATEEAFLHPIRGIYSAMVGRENEMKIMKENLETAMHSQGSVIIVSGEAGIGKSRLIWELGRKAKSIGARYFSAPCISGERDFPYKPILEIIRSYFATKGIREPEQLAVFLKQKAPHLVVRSDTIQYISLTGAGKKPSALDKDQLWDTFAEVIKLIAHDRPTILHIDDIHHADAPTLSLMIYLARRLRMERLMIIGAYRTEELVKKPQEHSNRLQSMLEIMAREGLGTEISLNRLDKETTKLVVDSVFADSTFPPHLYDSVYLETEGNPLFILEVLKLLKDEGTVEKHEFGWKLKSQIEKIAVPSRIHDIITKRMTRLNKQEKDILEVAAIEGYTFASDTICSVLDLRRINVLRHLQNLESSHHVIHALERGYQFDHGKIQEVIYDSMIPELKKEYHRLVSKYLLEQHKDEESYAAKIAHHLAAADLYRESLPYLTKAGDYAKKLYANQEAMRHYDAGLKLVDKFLDERRTKELCRTKITLLKARTDIRVMTGSLAEAQCDCDEVINIAEEIEENKEKADGLYNLGRISSIGCNFDDAVCYFNQARDIWKRLGDRSGEGRILTNLGVIHNRCGEYEKALNSLTQALKIHQETGNKKHEVTALCNLAAVNYVHGEFTSALKQAGKALIIFRKLGDRNGEAIQLVNIGAMHYRQGDLHKALEFYKEAFDISQKIGSLRNKGVCLDYMAAIYFKSGEIEKALNCFGQTVDLHIQTGNKDALAQTLANIGYINYCRGDNRKALKHYKDAMSIQKEIGNKRQEASILINVGHVYHTYGSYEKALKAYNNSLRIRKRVDDLDGQWESLHHIFRLLLNLGDYTNARSWYEQATNIPESKLTSDMKILSLADKGLYKFLSKKTRNIPTEIYRGLKAAVHASNLELTIEMHLLIARLQLEAKHYLSARQHAEKAIKLAREQSRDSDVARALSILSQVYFKSRRFSRAESYLKQTLELSERCNTADLIWRVHYLLGKIYANNKQRTKAKNEYRKAKKIVDGIASKLSMQLKKTYLNKTEIRQFYKDLKRSTSRKK